MCKDDPKNILLFNSSCHKTAVEISQILYALKKILKALMHRKSISAQKNISGKRT